MIREIFFKYFPSLIIFFGALAGFSLIIFSPFIPKSINLVEGEISKQTIVSPRLVVFESKQDKINNELKKKSIIKREFYVINYRKVDKILKQTSLFFEKVIENESESISKMYNFLSQEELSALFSISQDKQVKIKSVTMDILSNLMKEGIKTKDEDYIKFKSKPFLKELSFDEEINKIILKIVFYFSDTNFEIDKKQTKLFLENSIKSINFDKTTFKQGEPIVYSGEKITAKHIEVFQALNIYGLKADVSKFISIGLFSLLSLLIIERYIITFNQKLYNLKTLSLISVVITLILMFARVSLMMELFNLDFLFYLVIPISLSSIILSSLISKNVSFCGGIAISILTAVMYGGSFDVFVFLFLSNSVLIMWPEKKLKKSNSIKSGYIVGIMNVFFVVTIGVFSGESEWSWFLINSLFGMGNGVVSVMIATALLPYLETFFKITSNQTLLELSNLNHPILKRLMSNAPGTYQHSYMVANLAESAAEAVGANAILCRVGSYFHDIGKLTRPSFFAENQFSDENPHSTLSARMSKLIIISHAKDGVELAKKHKLPQEIIDIIIEHHGTSLLSLFYLKAIKSTEGDGTEKDEFRYPGPKPQSKESGIVMLADSVEAALRSIDKPTPQKIEVSIDKIINEKIDDTQLSECPLTIKELNQIKKAFMSILKGVHHNRVSYQKEAEEIIDHQKINKK